MRSVRDPLVRAARRAWPAAALAAAAVLAAGCFNPFDPRIASVRGATQARPVPGSARGVVELFQWCWNNRAYTEYTEIFTEDFLFQYVNRDSAGNQRSEFLNRDQELDTARNLFVEGTATEPPATRINLTYTNTLLAFPDSRPGKAFPWHQEIGVNLTLEIATDEQEYRINGRAVFYLVRGDSARIPIELRPRFPADTSRWWIEFWTDETEESPVAANATGETLPLSVALERARALAARPGATVRATLSGVPPRAARGRRPLQAATVVPRHAAGETAGAPPLEIGWARLKRAYLER